MKKFLLLIPLILFYVDYIARIYIIQALQLIIPAAGIALTLILGVYIYILIQKAREAKEMALTAKEKRLSEAREVIINGNQIFVKEPDDNAIYRALHLMPNSHSNGIQVDPSPLELSVYQQFHSKSTKAAPMLIEGQIQKPDLLKIMTQPKQAYAIVGRQQSGKSTKAMAIANHWLNQGFTPFVIGSKMKQGEWPNCQLLITSNIDKIEKALASIVLKGQAVNNSQVSNPDPRIIFLDDWLWTVRNSSYAASFFSEASTMLAGANIITYFILQSDVAHAYGGKEYGAMLKNSLTKLILEPITNSDGTIQPGISNYYIQYPGKKDKILVEENGNSIKNPKKEVIKSMLSEGKSYKTITEALYGPGKFGSFYNKQVDRLLES